MDCGFFRIAVTRDERYAATREWQRLRDVAALIRDASDREQELAFIQKAKQRMALHHAPSISVNAAESATTQTMPQHDAPEEEGGEVAVGAAASASARRSSVGVP